MNKTPDQSSPATAENDRVGAAFEALKTYDAGSGRATLWPLDEAVQRSLKDQKARAALEQRFILILRGECSGVAKQYVCSKLALIGSKSSVPVLIALLADPYVSASARTALEKIPGTTAAKALRASVGKLSGTAKIGALCSLGATRDAASVAFLATILRGPDPALAAAAAYALGQIGSTKAATVLKPFVGVAPGTIRLRVADASLVCAERLRMDGHDREAKDMYQALTSSALPAQVQQAARNGLEKS
jgi:HEAT repeat protein